MQTLQLLGRPGERLCFLKRARAHLRSGGLLAVAIVTEFEPFDCADGDDGPAPGIPRASTGSATSAARRGYRYCPGAS